MSIFNVFLSPECALIGFDTEASTPDESYHEGAKAIFLPHLSAALGFRGPADLLAFTSPSIIGFCGDFDNLTERLPQIIRGSRSAFIAHYGDSPSTQAASNFVLVGYSPKLGRMVGHAFECVDGQADIAEIRDFPQLFAPSFGEAWLRGLGVRADRQRDGYPGSRPVQAGSRAEHDMVCRWPPVHRRNPQGQHHR